MVQVLIIGGGLSGLHVARLLHRAGVDHLLLEAAPRLGGRILTEQVGATDAAGAYDLGPAWFWLAFQRRMAALVAEVGLRAFLQHMEGALMWEESATQCTRFDGGAPIDGSMRIAGGARRAHHGSCRRRRRCRRADGAAGDGHADRRGPRGHRRDRHRRPRDQAHGLAGDLDPAHARAGAGQRVIDESLAQLVRLFGVAAATPTATLYKDWATDPLVATEEDFAPLLAHPSYGHHAPLPHEWARHLVLAGTEAARDQGGFMEGALVAAEAAFAAITRA